MTLARIRYLVRQLSKKYKAIGRVAGKYLEAGFSVRINHPTHLGNAHIVAQGNGQKILVEVYYSSSPLKAEDVRKVAEKAKLLKAKPVIALYGRRTPVTPEALAEAAKLGVKVKRVRL
ncbi:hypothetical protein [Infirmifilum sp. SLHALR2]|nr:MAG: hypothetical protein B7L53_03285 [Thermofilum sp. NZ13]